MNVNSPPDSEPSGEGKQGGAIDNIGSMVTDNLSKVKTRERGFILLAAVLAVLMLGVLLLSRDTEVTKWIAAGTIGIFALACVFMFLQSRTQRPTSGSGDYEERRKAASSVNGDWWQLIMVDDPETELVVEGLTLVALQLLVDTGYYGVSGQLYNEQGKWRANWSADAVAMKKPPQVELFYRFTGKSFRKVVRQDFTGEVSGIGVFTFDYEGEESTVKGGNGWFATGDVPHLRFGKRRDVILRRPTADELKILGRRGRDARADEAIEKMIATRYANMERTVRTQRA